MRFLIDMPVTPEAVPHLQASGHDAVHASMVELSEASDREVLEAARREGRVVVTADLDYPRLLTLDRILAQGPTLDLERSITVVDRTRIRRHPLPPRSHPTA